MPSGFTWHDYEVMTKLTRLMYGRVEKATLYLQGEVRRAINRGNADGRHPSLPGEPPKKVTGRLFRSIAQTVTIDGSGSVIRGSVGTNVVYGRRLELGFVGTDARGRTVHQLPRPYLRSTLATSWPHILEILRGG